MTFGKECRFEDVKERMTKKVVQQVYEDELVRDDTNYGWINENGREHGCYIVEYGPSWVDNIEEITQEKLRGAGLLEEEESFDIDDFFAILLDEDKFNTTWAYSDEFTTCSDCCQIIVTQPQHHGWLPDYWIADGDIYCGDCIREDDDLKEGYLKDMTNNHERAITVLSESELLKMGYHKCNNEFEAGLRECQDDSPESILENAREMLDDDEFVFRIDQADPFSVHFSLFSRNSEEAEA